MYVCTYVRMYVCMYIHTVHTHDFIYSDSVEPRSPWPWWPQCQYHKSQVVCSWCPLARGYRILILQDSSRVVLECFMCKGARVLRELTELTRAVIQFCHCFVCSLKSKASICWSLIPNTGHGWCQGTNRSLQQAVFGPTVPKSSALPCLASAFYPKSKAWTLYGVPASWAESCCTLRAGPPR